MKRTIVVTGDKGGVGKSTIVGLLADWYNYQSIPVTITDSDPNQTIQTWIDKCFEKKYSVNSESSKIEIIDTAGTSGSSLIKYIQHSNTIIVPFHPHVSDLEIVIGWFLSLNEILKKKVYFLPNRLRDTTEQRRGLAVIKKMISSDGYGEILPGLRDRPAVYPPFLNGNSTPFFEYCNDIKIKNEINECFNILKI